MGVEAEIEAPAPVVLTRETVAPVMRPSAVPAERWGVDPAPAIEAPPSRPREAAATVPADTTTTPNPAGPTRQPIDASHRSSERSRAAVRPAASPRLRTDHTLEGSPGAPQTRAERPPRGQTTPPPADVASPLRRVQVVPAPALLPALLPAPLPADEPALRESRESREREQRASIHVSIGRVDVRTPPPAATRPASAPWRPRLSLDDYLRERSR